MKSSTENSYGARIGNAESLVTALRGFNNYQSSKPELGIEGFSSLIANIKNQNTQIAIHKQNYSLAVEERVKIFEKDLLSVGRILSPINATIKVSFGKEAKEATDVAAIISKIRGSNAKSLKSTEGTFVSQSHQSFNSKIQFFSDLIANLSAFGSNYAPSRDELSVENLKDLYENAVAANNAVIDAYSQFIQKNDIRLSAYDTLSKTAVHIKENVKAQYGYNSSQYNLIGKLKI
ncbi:hypothetical protein NAT51_11255 [Flavobacterium amniphilum]|uniref:hypothetical protein n=1 Tax=Flavobacterium amniphilum TaxID=1834035 RepID=UPI002029D0D7|nr:hypothetical protein [Flavobacterium amniphilum]MCL9806105.1 hypothetical protein [Flavobacterium amniphilum]